MLSVKRSLGACCKGMLEVCVHVVALTDMKNHTSVRGAAHADPTFVFTDIGACCFRCMLEKELTDIIYRKCLGSSSCRGCSFGRLWGCTSSRLVVAQYQACQPSPSSWLAPSTCFLLRATLSRHAPACGACSHQSAGHARSHVGNASAMGVNGGPCRLARQAIYTRVVSFYHLVYFLPGALLSHPHSCLPVWFWHERHKCISFASQETTCLALSLLTLLTHAT